MVGGYGQRLLRSRSDPCTQPGPRCALSARLAGCEIGARPVPEGDRSWSVDAACSTRSPSRDARGGRIHWSSGCVVAPETRSIRVVILVVVFVAGAEAMEASHDAPVPRSHRTVAADNQLRARSVRQVSKPLRGREGISGLGVCDLHRRPAISRGRFSRTSRSRTAYRWCCHSSLRITCRHCSTVWPLPRVARTARRDAESLQASLPTFRAGDHFGLPPKPWRVADS